MTRHLAAVHAQSQEVVRQRVLVPQVVRTLGADHGESHVVAAPHLQRIPPGAFQDVLLLESSEKGPLVPLGASAEPRSLGPFLVQMGSQVALDPLLPREADMARMGTARAPAPLTAAGCRGELSHRFYLHAAFVVDHACGDAACCEVANG